MRPSHLTFALAALVLAGCDSGGSPAKPDRETQGPPPLVKPPSASLQASAQPKPAGVAPKGPEVAIAQSGGRAPRPMAEKGLMPLAQILKIARRRVPGQVIEVELDDGDDDDEPEYELEILTPDGRSIEMKIDARRGTILDVEED